LLVVSTSAFAQPKGTPAPPEPSLWDHNGSVVSLIAQGSAREFHYKEPRPGILETRARPGSLLFRGKVMNGQYTGAAFMFDRRCGQVSYAVSGPILDNDQRVVLTGEAPLFRAKCRVQGYFTEVLEFRLKNANWSARATASGSERPLETDERAAAPVPAPPAPPRELQPASPNPPAVIAELVAEQKQAAAPPTPPSAPNPPAAVTDHAPAQKQGAAAPAPSSAATPPAVVADNAPAPKQAAAPSAPSSAAKPELTAEIERTRAARGQAAAAEAARAAELAAHRVFAEAEATRAAAETRLQQTRDDLQAAGDEDSQGRFRQTFILVAMSWTLLLLGATIVLLIVKLRRSRSLGEAENPKTGDASAATMFELPLYSRWSEIAAKADAANAGKSHGYQSGGRTRVFFQTRTAHH
jgi:hypothetical protein